MSTKSTLFLTKDNEHCYQEGNEPHYKNGNWIGDTIVLEISKSNVKILLNDETDLVLEFLNPMSEIYQKIIKMKD